jgi:hypothetical protein
LIFEVVNKRLAKWRAFQSEDCMWKLLELEGAWGVPGIEVMSRMGKRLGSGLRRVEKVQQVLEGNVSEGLGRLDKNLNIILRAMRSH